MSERAGDSDKRRINFVRDSGGIVLLKDGKDKRRVKRLNVLLRNGNVPRVACLQRDTSVHIYYHNIRVLTQVTVPVNKNIVKKYILKITTWTHRHVNIDYLH